MTDTALLRASALTCYSTTIRQASRHVSRLYDRCLAEVGLRATQYVVLAILDQRGPAGINEFSEALVMDRSTFGHNIRPLERDGFVELIRGEKDGRRRSIAITELGRAKVREAAPKWAEAQLIFETAFGIEDAKAMCRMLARVVDIPFS